MNIILGFGSTMELYSREYLLLCLIVISSVQNTVASAEPSCGKFAFEEQLLEKVVRMEIRFSNVENFVDSIKSMASELQELKQKVKSMEPQGNAEVVQTLSCPICWVFFNSSSYLFAKATNKTTFIEAEAYCRQHNAHLLQMETMSENLFVKDYIRGLKGAYYWIGLTDEKVEGIWQWNTLNSPTEYTDWGGTEPNSHGGDEDCVGFVNTNERYWMDVSCDSKRVPICEIIL